MSTFIGRSPLLAGPLYYIYSGIQLYVGLRKKRKRKVREKRESLKDSIIFTIVMLKLIL